MARGPRSMATEPSSRAGVEKVGEVTCFRDYLLPTIRSQYSHGKRKCPT